MITVNEAKVLISTHCTQLPAMCVPLAKAGGHLLAEDVMAIYDIPAYPQSSMDGYAFAFEDRAEPLRIVDEHAAGDEVDRLLERGTATRIFTGAAVPDGADTILMQEKAEVKDGLLSIPDSVVKMGDHVRPAGSEIEKDALALHKFCLLTPPAIGFLAAIGVADISVIPSPRVCIMVTGNELIQPGTGMSYGKVYEASSFALQAALSALQIHHVRIVHVKDDLEAMAGVLADEIEVADLVLMTGGVSVGDHDHTVKAAVRCGVQPIFHKVKQKPGKPIFFGKTDDTYFFGLPGNPASVLTCFYEYVLICLSRMTGRNMMLKELKAILAHDHSKPAGLTHFLRGVYEDGRVHIGRGQESYKLRSFATSNCLVVLPEQVEELRAGMEVDIHLLL
jgi:molybdopterin molybdotransferase